MNLEGKGGVLRGEGEVADAGAQVSRGGVGSIVLARRPASGTFLLRLVDRPVSSIASWKRRTPLGILEESGRWSTNTHPYRK